jgi:hypothetical protein
MTQDEITDLDIEKTNTKKRRKKALEDEEISLTNIRIKTRTIGLKAKQRKGEGGGGGEGGQRDGQSLIQGTRKISSGSGSTLLSFGSAIAIPTTKHQKGSIMNDVVLKVCHSRKKRLHTLSSVFNTISSKRITTVASIIEISPEPDIQACRYVLNTMVKILPVDARINLFGYWHSIIVCGVFYKADNLTWIFLNRNNLKFYVSCHLVTDAVSLFNRYKHVFPDPDRADKKWNRQGVNDVVCLFQNQFDMKKDRTYKLNKLPGSVLKFKHTTNCINIMNEFIRSCPFVYNYTRKTPIPQLNTNLPLSLVSTIRYRALTNPQVVMDTCKRIEQDKILDVKDATEAASHFLDHVPSSLSPEIICFYQDFRNHVRDHPTLFYHPQGDYDIATDEYASPIKI